MSTDSLARALATGVSTSPLILYKSNLAGTYARTMRQWGALGGFSDRNIFNWIDSSVDADITNRIGSVNTAPMVQAAFNSLSNTGGKLFVPDGLYRLSQQLVMTSPIHLSGSCIVQDSRAATVLSADKGATFYSDAGVAGLLLQYINDNNRGGPAIYPGSGGAVIEDIRFLSAGAAAPLAGNYGIDCRVGARLIRLEVRGYGDHGVVVQASGSGSDGVVYGNANGALLLAVHSIVNAGDGIKISGNDANVCNVIDCLSQSNTGWAVTDDSLIQTNWVGVTDEGNTAGGYRTLRAGVVSSFVGCETENNTPARHSIGASCTVRGGNLEQVTSMPAWQSYSGLTVRSGKALALNDAGNSVAFGMSNDGANILVGAPIKVQGSIQCRNGVLGYIGGNGGSVTQLTDKTTGVHLDSPCGQITMAPTALAANAVVSFSLTCSSILADDGVRVRVKGGNATVGTYRVWSEGNANGIRTIVVENRSAGSLSEALVLGYEVITGSSF